MDLGSPYSLRVYPEDAALRVVSFRGREAASELYQFDVVVSSKSDALPGAELLGRRASLDIALDGDARRVVHGLILGVATEDAMIFDDELCLRVRLSPKLWLLGRDRRSRIRQNASVRDVVEEVLSESGIPFEWRVSRQLRVREYRVQYRESTLEYIERLLGEEGLFYWFAHDADRGEEVVCIGDSPSQYDTLPGDPNLRFEDAGDMIARECISRFTVRHEVCPEEVLLTGFDFRRPQFSLRGEAVANRGTGVLVHDHHGDLDEMDLDDATAERMLQAERGMQNRGEGRSTCRRLTPCTWFELADHPNPALDGRYVVLAVEHAGDLARQRESAAAGPAFSNSFECAPASMMWRPPPRRLPLQQVTETATVVGPDGEDIHTDEHGRVKVQFHWDLYGARNEHSSCWLRCAQAWAGAAWGAQFVPRIGMEVVVTFIGGDVDRPMIIGAVYNGLNPPPFALPGCKTQSGIRTKSTPTGGSNEIRFEDATGSEHIYIHAERDFEKQVENDYVRMVRGAEAVSVARDRTVDVQGDHVRTVHGSEVVSIQRHLVMDIAGRQVIHVGGASTEDGVIERALASAASETGEPTVEEAAGIATSTGPAPVLATAERSHVTGAATALSPAQDDERDRIAHARLRWMAEQLDGPTYAVAEQRLIALKRYRSRLRNAVATLARQDERADVLVGRALNEVRAVESELEAAPTVGSSQLEGAERFAEELRAQEAEFRGEVELVLDALQRVSEGEEAAGSGSGEAGGNGDPGWKKTGNVSLLDIRGGGVLNSPDGLSICGQAGAIDIHNGVMTLRASKIELIAGTIEIKGGETNIKGAPIRLN